MLCDGRYPYIMNQIPDVFIRPYHENTLRHFLENKGFPNPKIRHLQSILISFGHLRYLQNLKRSRNKKEIQNIHVSHPKTIVIDVESITKEEKQNSKEIIVKIIKIKC